MAEITALVVTSPIPSHPSTEVIDETLLSIRDRLPDAEIVVSCDGPHPGLTPDRTGAYHESLQRLTWDCQHRWNALPVVHRDHLHQLRLTRHALTLVRTPIILFVEHDTPLVGDVDWEGCTAVIRSGAVHMIRLHHEASILDVHRHLMLGDGPTDIGGVPLWPTVQWSQRPHLASTGWYRCITDMPWWAEHDGMIEDRMHSVVQEAWATHGQAGWDQFRLAVYHPDGDIKRSTHLDGRAGDEKVTFR